MKPRLCCRTKTFCNGCHSLRVNCEPLRWTRSHRWRATVLTAQKMTKESRFTKCWECLWLSVHPFPYTHTINRLNNCHCGSICAPLEHSSLSLVWRNTGPEKRNTIRRITFTYIKTSIRISFSLAVWLSFLSMSHTGKSSETNIQGQHGWRRCAQSLLIIGVNIYTSPLGLWILLITTEFA